MDDNSVRTAEEVREENLAVIANSDEDVEANRLYRENVQKRPENQRCLHPRAIHENYNPKWQWASCSDCENCRNYMKALFARPYHVSKGYAVCYFDTYDEALDWMLEDAMSEAGEEPMWVDLVRRARGEETRGDKLLAVRVITDWLRRVVGWSLW